MKYIPYCLLIVLGILSRQDGIIGMLSEFGLIIYPLVFFAFKETWPIFKLENFSSILIYIIIVFSALAILFSSHQWSGKQLVAGVMLGTFLALSILMLFNFRKSDGLSKKGLMTVLVQAYAFVAIACVFYVR